MTEVSVQAIVDKYASELAVERHTRIMAEVVRDQALAELEDAQAEIERLSGTGSTEQGDPRGPAPEFDPTSR